MKLQRRHLAALIAPALGLAGPVRAESQCFGTVARGRLEGGVPMPLSKNVTLYSAAAPLLGRTHVHTRVAATLARAWALLATKRPDSAYVLGESGWPRGGRFRPHRSHQNGLSVDIFVPVEDAQGRSVPLPTPATKRFGYDLEFDAKARLGSLRIDFPALAALLQALHRAAQAEGIGIAKVIFDRRYLPQLFAADAGTRGLPFMKGEPWVRHDDHVHIDFAVACKPL